MKTQIYQIIFMAIFGALGSVLIGLILYGAIIFSPHSSGFMFVAAGVYGSVFFGLLEYEHRKGQILGIIIIFFFNLVVFQGRSVLASHVIRDLLWLGGLFASVKLYHMLIKRNPKLKFYIRSFALAFIFGVFSVISSSILFLINIGKFPHPSFLYLMGRYGILIGFGIGMGLDLYLNNKDTLLRVFKIKSV